MALTEIEKNLISNMVQAEMGENGSTAEQLFNQIKNYVSGFIRGNNGSTNDLTSFQLTFLFPQRILSYHSKYPQEELPTGIGNATLGEARKHFIECVLEGANNQGARDQCDKEGLLTLVEQMPDYAWQFNRESGELIVPEEVLSESLPGLVPLNAQRQGRDGQRQRIQGGRGESQQRQGGRGRQRRRGGRGI